METTLIVKKKEYNNKKLIYITVSLGIAYFLISSNDIMWTQDRFNYLRYATSSGILIQNSINQGLLRFLSNEPLFLILNYILSFLFSPENVVNLIIFNSTFLTLYSLGRLSKYNFWILFLFLWSPTILLKYLTHIRQGLAISIYLIGLLGYVENKKFKNIRFLSPLIHSSMFFLLLYEVLEFLFKKFRFNSSLRIFFSSVALTGFMVLIPVLSMILDDRRNDIYEFSIGLSGSGFGFLFWLLSGSYFVFFKRKDYVSIICSYGIIFYLISYFYLDFGARIFESIYPLIVLSVVRDKRQWFRVSYIVLLFFYGLLSWYLRGGIKF